MRPLSDPEVVEFAKTRGYEDVIRLGVEIDECLDKHEVKVCYEAKIESA